MVVEPEAGWSPGEEFELAALYTVEEEQPDAVLEVMGLELGDVAADIGCGAGYYARRMAGRVGSAGRVYCVDIQPEMLDIMQQLADRDGVTGVVPVLSEVDDPKLPDA